MTASESVKFIDPDQNCSRKRRPAGAISPCPIYCRKAQLELRVGLGSGKLPDKALLFVGINGALPSQKYYSKAWSDFADQIGMPDLGFHNLRHTHARQLIAM